MRQKNENDQAIQSGSLFCQDSLKQAIAVWPESSMALRESMNGLFEVLGNGQSMGVHK